jgi:hypothetical protein
MDRYRDFQGIQQFFTFLTLPIRWRGKKEMMDKFQQLTSEEWNMGNDFLIAAAKFFKLSIDRLLECLPPTTNREAVIMYLSISQNIGHIGRACCYLQPVEMIHSFGYCRLWALLRSERCLPNELINHLMQSRNSDNKHHRLWKETNNLSISKIDFARYNIKFSAVLWLLIETFSLHC